MTVDANNKQVVAPVIARSEATKQSSQRLTAHRLDCHAPQAVLAMTEVSIWVVGGAHFRLLTKGVVSKDVSE